jgi:hypothetical protein
MAKPKIVQVCMTHDGRIASVLYDDGRVFLYAYTKDPIGEDLGKGFWSELNYPELKSKSLPESKRSKSQ